MLTLLTLPAMPAAWHGPYIGTWHPTACRCTIPATAIKPASAAITTAFNAAEPFMFNRMVLPGGNGFMYQQGATRILWSTADAEHDLGGSAMVTDLMSGAVHNTARLKSGRLRVYQISKM